TRERAVRFINNVEGYSDFLPMEIPIHVFLKVWLPDMKKENRTLGINWTGATTIALEMTPDEVLSKEELLQKVKNLHKNPIECVVPKRRHYILIFKFCVACSIVKDQNFSVYRFCS
ncbi:MAG: DUF2750 domain-containing protein, partial [Desulfobacteraceae bacterium]